MSPDIVWNFELFKKAKPFCGHRNYEKVADKLNFLGFSFFIII